MLHELIEKAMAEYWDPEFLEELDKYAFDINEHKLIDSIKGVISLALDKQNEEFGFMIEQCMTFNDGSKIDKYELRNKLDAFVGTDVGGGK